MAALAAAAVLVTGGIAAPAGAGAAPTTGHAGAPMTSSTGPTYFDASVLNGVSARSGSDAWAVGTYTDTSAVPYKTLILHWNGTAWKKVKSPNPGSYSNELHGVSAVSRSNAWAVGSYTDPSGGALTYKTLILHWNGTAWSKVKTPNPGGSFNELVGVSAVSGSNAWAVGRYNGYPARAYATLILHWNGTAWSQVKSPNPGTVPIGSPDNWLSGVSAVSGSNAWAVGGYDNNGAATGSLVLHWNGTAWSQVNSPNLPNNNFPLDGVSARSGSDAWAVGSHGALGSAFFDTMILHWNGTAWSQVNSPSPGSGSYLQDENYLRGVSAVSGSDAWAVGDYTDPTTGHYKTMILHWNGTAWTQVNSPSPSRGNLNELDGVSARSGSDAWAVGSYIDTTGAFKMLVLRWNGTAWAKAPAVKTATAVSSSANPVTTGHPVTYTATVTPTPAQNAGTVSFYDNGSLIRWCTAMITSGRATCPITYASAGSHTIKATYSGYAVLSGRSTSPPLTETVKAPATTSVPVSSR